MKQGKNPKTLIGDYKRDCQSVTKKDNNVQNGA